MSDREVTGVNVSSSRYTITEYANVPKGTRGVWDRPGANWIQVSARTPATADRDGRTPGKFINDGKDGSRAEKLGTIRIDRVVRRA
eukprot:30667-Pelagococcus_subviridis.AAC.3